jgi:hypothetical protein
MKREFTILEAVTKKSKKLIDAADLSQTDKTLVLDGIVEN